MTSNPLSSDFSYRKYSLEQLDNWVHDALNCEDLTPQDIYNTVVKCVDDSVEYHKKQLTKGIELLSLLKGHREVDFGVGNDEPWEYDAAGGKFPKATNKDWVDFWEENYYPEEYKEPSVEDIMPPWGHSDMEALRYTEEELNAMCDKAASDEEKNKCREYNLREAEYYDKRAELDAKQDKVIKWQLPVDVDGLTGDCFVQFPDDLLEISGLREGDIVDWIDRGDGSFELRKVTKPLEMDEC